MIIKYIILGFIQGLTEFMPVSSSAHLAIMQRLMGMSGQELVITVALHLGTTVALIIFFFKDILKILKDVRMILFVVIVTLITGTIGALGKHFSAGLFENPRAIALAWLVCAGILFSASRFLNKTREQASLTDAVIMGITQAIAIIPGISRSGITISTLLFRGLNRETAFRLSFVAAIPTILGAALLESKDIAVNLKTDSGALAIGCVISLLAGLFALSILQLVIGKAKLHYFGCYCVIAAILTLLFVR